MRTALPHALQCRNRHHRTPLHMAAQSLPATCAHLTQLLRFGRGELVASAAGAANAAPAAAGPGWSHIPVAACAMMDSKGAMPLHRAVEMGCLASTVALLASTPRPAALHKNHLGECALYIAALRGHPSLLRACLASIAAAGTGGGDDDGTPRAHCDSFSPLQAACIKGDVECVELAASSGLWALDERNRYGLSALHLAARGGWGDCCLSLIGRGADVNAKDEYGLQPVDLALEHGNAETAALLQSHGGAPSAASLRKKKGQRGRSRGGGRRNNK